MISLALSDGKSWHEFAERGFAWPQPRLFKHQAVLLPAQEQLPRSQK